MAKSRLEQETTISFNAEEPDATCWTANPLTVKKWEKQGYEVEVKSTFNGKPSGWQTLIPKKCIKFAKLKIEFKKPSQKAIVALQPHRFKRQLKSTPLNPSLTPPEKV